MTAVAEVRAGVPVGSHASWLDTVIAAYGEPKIAIATEQILHTDEGRVGRRCWVWFPGDPPRNHNVRIDRRLDGRGWILGIGCHLPNTVDVELRMANEPDEFQIAMAFTLANWRLPAPTQVAACPTGFVWIGQSYAHCEVCSLPAWDHPGWARQHPETPFDDAALTELVPWRPGEADAIRRAVQDQMVVAR
jgi:hypothetical protein